MRSMKHSDALCMDTLVALPEAMTYSAMIVDGDIEGGEQVITELMMRRACELKSALRSQSGQLQTGAALGSESAPARRSPQPQELGRSSQNQELNIYCPGPRAE